MLFIPIGDAYLILTLSYARLVVLRIIHGHRTEDRDDPVEELSIESLRYHE
jgi:hypothetical protein